MKIFSPVFLTALIGSLGVAVGLGAGSALAQDSTERQLKRSTASGMIGYWAFNEGKGDVTKNTVRGSPDIFGSSGHAMIKQPVWMAGKYGKAIDFSGSKTAVLLDKTTVPECEKEVSITAWVKLKETRGRGMVVTHNYAYRLFVTQAGRNRVGFQLNLNGEWASNWLIGRTSLENGKWYHIAGVYDGKERRIYIDGKLDAVEPAGGTIGDGRDFVIGAQGIKTDRKRVFRANERVKSEVVEPFGGVIDEVKVWNRALSSEEVARTAKENQTQVASLLGDHRDLYFYAVKSVSMHGEDEPYELAVFNGAAKPFSGDVVVTVSGPEGETVYENTHRIDIMSRESRTISIPVKAAQAAAHKARVVSHGDEIFETSLITLTPQARRAVGKPKLKKVLSVDLTKVLGPDEFLDDGTSRIVDSPIGAYREAGARKFSRFVARLPLRRRGLHLVRVTYPDDKVRTCEIATRSPIVADGFNAHSGYFTGGDFPISGKLQTFEFIMWARDVEQALVFTTWLDGQPAAASAIEVFEIDGRLPVGEASRAPSLRHIGHFWEDAQPLSRSFGGNAGDLEDFDATVRNMCDYFDYTGQNMLMHPVVWYEGPIYNSLVEVRGGRGGFHFPTAGWVDILLKRFEERGFKFYALFNVHQLPSLMNTMNVDTAKIQAGEPTFNTVSRDNETLIKTWHHRSSMFNALHPRVQERVLALVEEVGDRYAGSPAFAGIGFHLTMAQLLQPGGLEVSYDDWTVGEFEKDTGMKIPVNGSDPERFGKRYEWIMENAKDEWIQWRCERIAEYYGNVAKILRDKRKDLQLVVTILEPPMSIIDSQRQAWMDGKRLVELSREGGIDPALLAKHPGVVIQQRLGPTATRKRLTFGVTKGKWGGPPPTQESIDAIREMDFAEDQQREFKTTEPFGVFLYNRYFESSIGRTKPMESDWFKSLPYRASAVVPAHEHFMEYYAHAMAMLDPTFIAVGGFTNGTVGHESQVHRFAQVYRQLPAGKWQSIAGLGEHVVGRTTQAEGKKYLYLVNRSPWRRRVVLREAGGMKPVGGSPQLAKGAKGWSVELEAYQLAAWAQSLR